MLPRSRSARGKFRGKALVDALIDLPFAVSPVVIGLSLILVYGTTGWFGEELAQAGIQIIFSVPGIVLATIFVSLPFVVREVDAGAARGRRRAGAGGRDARRVGVAGVLADHAAVDPLGVAYGVVLSVARCIGEFGAVSVGQGKISGETETLTLLVEKRFANFDVAGAYAASALLALIAFATLLLMTVVNAKERRS